MHPSRVSVALVTLRVHIGQGYLYHGMGSDVHRPTSVRDLVGSGPVVVADL